MIYITAIDLLPIFWRQKIEYGFYNYHYVYIMNRICQVCQLIIIKAGDCPRCETIKLLGEVNAEAYNNENSHNMPNYREATYHLLKSLGYFAEFMKENESS